MPWGGYGGFWRRGNQSGRDQIRRSVGRPRRDRSKIKMQRKARRAIRS